jgi:hypothetical protein
MQCAQQIYIGGKRVKTVALAMALLMGFIALATPAHATPYEITCTLKENEVVFWTDTISAETANNKTMLISIGLYNAIQLWFATNTFHTPFTLNFPVNDLSLEVTSIPNGLTIIFQPMPLGDVNEDKVVDIYDLVSVVQFFGNYSLFFDLYFDFTFEIDIYDLVIIAMNFGQVY